MGEPLGKFSTFIFENGDVEKAVRFFIELGVKKENIRIFEQLKIDDVRNLREETGIQRDYKLAFLIGDLSFEAQNALLKLTEEAPEGVYFGFYRCENLLDTVYSRAQVVRFKKGFEIDGAFKEALLKKDREAVFKFLFSSRDKPDILNKLKFLINFYAEKGVPEKAEAVMSFYKDFKEFNLNETLILINVFACLEDEL